MDSGIFKLTLELFADIHSSIASTRRNFGKGMRRLMR